MKIVARSDERAAWVLLLSVICWGALLVPLPELSRPKPQASSLKTLPPGHGLLSGQQGAEDWTAGGREMDRRGPGIGPQGAEE